VAAALALLSAACGLLFASGAEGPGSAAKAGDVPDAIARAVADPARPEGDRARDADRKPAEVLAFFGIAPGMKVADMMAGTGYYTEILSRIVGKEGHVYAQNSKFVLDRFADKPLAERLARPGLENVTRVDRDPADPGLPSGLDAVILVRFYHDFYWQGVDRAAFDKAVFEALRPGGVFGVVDHRAEPGSGDRDAKEQRGLHRVDEEMVKKEILAAGFELDGESNALAVPSDQHDWPIFADGGARRDKTDRFVLRFRKPE